MHVSLEKPCRTVFTNFFFFFFFFFFFKAISFSNEWNFTKLYTWDTHNPNFCLINNRKWHNSTFQINTPRKMFCWINKNLVGLKIFFIYIWVNRNFVCINQKHIVDFFFQFQKKFFASSAQKLNCKFKLQNYCRIKEKILLILVKLKKFS